LYGKNIHNYLLDYTTQFWEAYPDNRKIFRTHFSEAHELSGELIGYVDEDIRDFLEDFYQKGYFEDTVLLLLSDHGSHSVTLRLPIFPDNSRYIENYLPMMFQITPKDVQKRYLGYLKANEQSLVSSHDVYGTLAFIATNKNIHDYSFMSQQLPEARECINSDIFLLGCWCQHDVKNLTSEMAKKPMFSFSF
jgi:phosphoglycerol transferase MdoB-like AlkP superfamily enzyme